VLTVIPALRRLRSLPAPSAATLLAGIALFFALSGSVVAATHVSRNSIGSRQIKNGSIKPGDIAKNSLTGVQIDESRLGMVPRAGAAGTATTAQAAAEAQHAATATRANSAAVADRATTAASADTATSADRAAKAGDAETVDGRSANAFAAANEVFPVAIKLKAGESRTVVERDRLKLVARCSSGVGTISGGTADVLTLTAESSVDGASFKGPSNELDGSAGNSLGPGTPEAKRLVLLQSANTGVKVVRAPTAEISATSAGGTSVFVGAGGAARVAFNLYGAVCTFSAPVMVTAF
jgi:hypothetical protein